MYVAPTAAATARASRPVTRARQHVQELVVDEEELSTDLDVAESPAATSAAARTSRLTRDVASSATVLMRQ